MRRPWEFLKGDTFPKLLQERALLNPRGVAFREKTWGIWRPTTWHEYYERVSKFAYGLLALGFRRGDHLAVVGYNRPEILIAEQSAMALGGISVGVYPDTLPEERAYWLDYTDVKVVVAEDQEQVDKILVVKKDLPKLEYIIYWDERMMWQYKDIKEPRLLSWKEVEKLGEEVRKSDSKLLEELIAKTHPDDVCLILSTSGTTGRPKGVMLTYSSMMSMAKNLWEVDPIEENFEYVSYLPFGWIGEQMMSLAMHMLVGFKINFVEEPETFWRDFREIAPHFMFGPARVYEMIYSKIMEHLEDAWDFDKKIFEIALNIGYRKVEAELTGKRIPFWLTLLWHISRMLIYRSILDKTGLKRIKYAYVGGSFLGPDYLKFYRALGVNLKRIWGMTEVSGIATVHPDNEVRLDTVGKPIANTEIKIAEDGEILVRTPAVMAGYYKRPEATAEALKDGWLYTGDVGMLTEDGHLVYLGRKEDMQRLEDGTNFSALFIENMLKFSPYIKEAFVYGEGKPYIVAIININFDVVSKWAEKHGIAYTSYQDLSQKKEVYDLLEEVIKKVNATLPERLRIKAFTSLFKEFHPDDGEMTRTRKLRRVFITEKYKGLLEAMYRGDSTYRLRLQIRYEDGSVRDVEMEVSIRRS
ncbi:AMP-dependent synthetase/ligase [Pyrobaculum aerophilum]|uniref:Long-chain fatty acid--CoA ligase n=1 Tax=Pyrobaculum aerophilum TaxID=13773 RepID=A0A371QVH3_9CREN|nr:AMP-binding protein [Pyrobaculum aerophilum]RFA93949.1 long-chain fatty acid--CoA ligase [Pyrobaculum aerophilum]RFA96837.1 long-chain fatty acid--CoA ligase [Pyrobaculum aerophilum]